MLQSKYRTEADEAGAWSVIDAKSEMPAVLDGVPQVGLGEDEAERVAETLNAMLNDDDG